MNGSKSPGPPNNAVHHDSDVDKAELGLNGHTSPKVEPPEPGEGADIADKETVEPNDALPPDAPADEEQERAAHAHLDEEDGNSEAETLIDSPVKKSGATKHAAIMAKTAAKAPRHLIGGLPVPTGDEEDTSSAASPLPNTRASEVKAISSGSVKDVNPEKDVGSDGESSSGSLSSISKSGSPVSSRSRAMSARPSLSRNGAHSPNPRKRKHRASSVSLPNKRQSMDPPKRVLRGMHSEDNAASKMRSHSPNLRSHRRAISTQSAFVDGNAEVGSRKRKSDTAFPARDPKVHKAAWEESDASSETTSHGHLEQRRPQRGIGRSTSTRPVARDHKRHVNKYGFTRLAEACEIGDLDLVKEWREKDADQLELAEYAGNKPLQIAALNGNRAVVEYLIDQGCQIDCANLDKDTPLIDAAENGHLDVVRVLLRAGVDPIQQNLKGQQAMDVVTDDYDDADAIRAALREAIEAWNSSDAKQRREEDEIMRHRARPAKELHFMARTYENLLKLVTINDRNGVSQFLDARVPVDNVVIAAAARTGDSYLVNMLLAEMPGKKAWQKAEKPMLAVVGSSHWEMVKNLTELEQFNPLYRNRAGKSWSEIAEERNGPNLRQEVELLQRLYDERARILGRRGSSPIAKRDHIPKQGRYSHPPDGQDSDEEHAPKRKNGRRLMSRRDIRAANPQATIPDEESEDASTSDNEPEPVPIEEKTVKASITAGSPTSQKRGPGRPRNASLTTQPPVAEPLSSPRTRRRSSSLRNLPDKHAPSDSALSTVEENAEAKDAGSGLRGEVDEDRRQEAKVALEEAQREERQVAEAEAIKVQAEHDRAEAERKAKEKEQAQEERRVKEAGVAAELERQAAEERKSQEAKRRERKHQHQKQILSLLPKALAYVLDSDSDFRFEGLQDLSYLLEYFVPLLVLRHPSDGSLWMTNVQASVLIGKRGLQYFLLKTSPGYEDVAQPLQDGEMLADENLTACMDRTIKEVIAPVAGVDPLQVASKTDADPNEWRDFHIELTAAAERRNAGPAILEGLRKGPVALYWIKLQWVLDNLHPLLKSTPLPLRYIAGPRMATTDGVEDADADVNAMARLVQHWTSSPLLGIAIHGQVQPAPGASDVSGVTNVVMVRQK